MCNWASANGLTVPPDATRLIGKNKLMLAADVIRGSLGDRTGECLNALLDPPNIASGDAHALAWRLPFAAIVTTNFDRLLDKARPNGVPVHTWRDAEGITRVGSGQERALVKIHGCLDDPSTVILGKADYRQLLLENKPYREFIRSLLYGKTILFVGYGLEDYDLEPLMEEMQHFLPAGRLPDFALCDTRDMAPSEIEAYKSGFGIELIYDPDAKDRPDYAAFLEQLQRELPAPDTKPAREASEADIGDIQRLLEDSGQKGVTHRRVGDSICFLGEQRVGVEDKRIVTHFVPGEARVDDLDLRPEGDSALQVIAAKLPHAVREEAARRGVPIYSRDEFVGRLVDFEPHHAALRDENIKLEIENYYVPLDALREGSDRRSPLEAYVDHWLSAPGRNMLSVLGDFGTGKTWFVRRLAERMIGRAGARIPVLILLRDYSKAVNMKDALTDAMVNQSKVRLADGIRTLQRLNEEGRLVLIFDGFDEMERRVSDHQTAEENFKRIEEWAVPNAKVLLTCRTEFFKSRRHEVEVLERELSERVICGEVEVALGKQPESIRLAPFTDDQLKKAFELRMGVGWQHAYERINGIPGLQELTDRPVLVEMITRSWDKLKDGGPVSLSGLYKTYAEYLLALRPQDTITVEQRLAFVETLAYDMQRSGNERVAHKAFKDRVIAQFQVEGDKQLDYWETQTRTASLLRRDGKGVYQFAHKSMREYFVARRLAERILAGDADEMALTDAIGRFVFELLAGRFPYEVVERDGMIWVPPGPFVFGANRESNMRVMSLPGFWIDKHPVTNSQFLEFLKEKGGEVEWFSPQYSRIQETKRKTWEVKPEYETHPVTGVSWFGAAAHAKWSRKRLPTEEEWERATRGVDAREYPWGQVFDLSRCNSGRSGRDGTSEVGAYGAAGLSPWGASDMAGNVWEWTATPGGDGSRVVRGGAWSLNVDDLFRCACRYHVAADYRSNHFGFRCARTTP